MRKIRLQKGHTVIELGCMALMVAIMTLFVLDAAVVVFAQNILDEACRDAARCAAQAPDNVNANSAASNALARHLDPNAATPWINNLTLLNVNYQSIANDPSYSLPNGGGGASGGTMPGIPFVSVTAQLTAHMPAVIDAYGIKLGDKDMVFKDTTTYPIINDPVPNAFNSFDNMQPSIGPNSVNNHLPCLNGPQPPPLSSTACPATASTTTSTSTSGTSTSTPGTTTTSGGSTGGGSAGTGSGSPGGSSTTTATSPTSPTSGGGTTTGSGGSPPSSTSGPGGGTTSNGSTAGPGSPGASSGNNGNSNGNGNGAAAAGNGAHPG